jgi:hypothetical protein
VDFAVGSGFELFWRTNSTTRTAQSPLFIFAIFANFQSLVEYGVTGVRQNGPDEPLDSIGRVLGGEGA